MPSGDIKYPGSTGIAGFIKMVGDRIFLRCLRINGRLYARDLAFILLSILGIPIAGRTVSRRGRSRPAADAAPDRCASVRYRRLPAKGRHRAAPGPARPH